VSSNVSIDDVRAFWNENSCGKKFIETEVGSKKFFDELESHRYRLEPHILRVVPFASLKGKKVLEIGCGLGTDAVQFARAGADYTGIDLTDNAIRLTKQRFDMEGLRGDIRSANVESLPFGDGSFDLVYSHGVIHHTPNIEKAVSEIHRVLKGGGRAIVMVYHRNSFNYRLNILFLRRIGLLALLLPGVDRLIARATGESPERLREHRDNFRCEGWSYLSSATFLNNNTDGVGNPLSRVYSRRGLRALFAPFRKKSTTVRFLNTFRIPVVRKLGGLLEALFGRLWGWHLYVLAEK
jgi:ubiquinone/menaquinone biosynthesis C-methylase UbiE